MNNLKVISFSGLPGSKSQELLANPDRGFRLEVPLDVGLNTYAYKRGFGGTTAYLKHQYQLYIEQVLKHLKLTSVTLI